MAAAWAVTVTVSVLPPTIQPCVDPHHLAGPEHDVRLLKLLEPRLADLDTVVAGAQVGDLEVARVVALAGPRHAGILVGHEHRGPDDHPARRVLHGPPDGTERGLRGGPGDHRDHERHAEGEPGEPTHQAPGAVCGC